MFGINGAELLVILALAVVIVGPARLPEFAKQLKGWAANARNLLAGARTHVEHEVGADSIDWDSLDPRQYDPRRIVREALSDGEAFSLNDIGSGSGHHAEPHHTETGPPMPTDNDDPPTDSKLT